MIEDKLTTAERIRLESLSQSVQLQITMPNRGLAAVLKDAEVIEKWLRAAKEQEQ